MTPQPFSIDTLLERVAAEDASDLHITAGSAPVLRVRGHLAPLEEFEAFAPEETRDLLYRILSTEQQKRLEIDRQLDFSYSVPGVARFRVNVYFQRDSLAAAFRLVPRMIKSAQELGLPEVLRELAMEPRGLVLITGPTGSGKSTTLYAGITQVNRPDINIITVEDPVEFRISGVNQVQINVRAGLTFAAALRSILRSDPDVVMVGEIRDGETAKISIEAALTGHLVLSTLHTNDAPGAITRLNEMGVEPFLTGSAVSAVLAQRLTRKLCTHCCEMYTPTTDEMIKARVSPEVAAAADGVVFYRKKGCPRCGQTGYKGRVGVYQLLVMSEQLESLAASKASREELERAAIEEGMRTLWDDGLAKVAAGLTSLEELARVTV